MHTFDNASDTAVAAYLQSQKLYLSVTAPNLAGPSLADMAVGRRAMQTRLGIVPDKHIVFWVLCEMCWRRHGVVADINDLPSSTCSREDCDGTVYKVVERSEGRQKCIPVKIAPYAPLEEFVRRILLRPGKYDELRTQLQGPEERDAGDGHIAPLAAPLDPLDAFPSHSVVLRDIKDGYGLRTLAAGLK